MGNNIKKISFLCFIFLVCLYCNKKDTTVSKKTFAGAMSEFTDLSKYTINKKIINDSTIQITGKNNNYIISGFVEKNTNKNIKWWKVIDRKDSTNKLIIQYLIVDENSFPNQILYYKKNKLDSLNSKFYLKKEINDKIKFSFYLPHRKDIIISSKFYYKINNNKYNVTCEKKFGHYECIIKNESIESLIGLFTEAIDSKNEDIGISEIYIDN